MGNQKAEQRRVGGLKQAVIKPDDIINSLNDVIIIIGREYNIEDINNSGLELLGKSRKKVLGEKCYQAIHSETEPCEYCPITYSFKTKKTESIERYLEPFARHFRIRSAPIIDEHGEVARCVFTMTDITDKYNAEAKQKRLQEELSLNRRLASIGQVAAGITHEINNPLTGVIAFAQMLMQMDVPENMKEAVEVIYDGANRVVGIVDKLRTFARRDRPEKEHADINAIITNTLAIRAYEMRTNNIEAITHFDKKLPTTVANIGQLQQVFLNIIVNAEQAMTNSSRSKKLVITTKQVNGSIRVSFRDNGQGITDDIIDKLFDPFFSTKDAGSGMGLGLNISHGIITEHGGEIRVRSRPGYGATFTIFLPIVSESKKDELDMSVSMEKEKPTGARILVVDDEPNICRALEKLLSREGHKVITTSNPVKALDILSNNRCDLILMDLRMPNMSGIELYKRIGDISPELQQKIICVTGDVVSVQNQNFLNETGIPCVAKPFGIAELTHQVKQVLEGEKTDAQVTYSHS